MTVLNRCCNFIAISGLEECGHLYLFSYILPFLVCLAEKIDCFPKIPLWLKVEVILVHKNGGEAKDEANQGQDGGSCVQATYYLFIDSHLAAVLTQKVPEGFHLQ